MSRRRLRVAFFTVASMLIASQLPAPIHPDCSNQPNLACGLVCTQYGCAIVSMPDPTDNHYYCYYVGDPGSQNCLGGYYHTCCE